MNHRSSNCSRRFRAATLIEVLAGLAILGSVTVALLLARGRLLEQHALAMHKLEAVKLADRLLADWYAQDDGVPVDTDGAVDGHPGWSWRTRVLDTDTQAMMNTNVIRLELYSDIDYSVAASNPGSEVPIVVVEVLTPGPGESL